MARVRSKDTTPEREARRALSAAKVRYRLHVATLPGRPDIYVPRLRLAVFVNGCFWHGHDCKRGRRKPRANADYWKAKIERNIDRDLRVLEELRAMGTESVTLWTCDKTKVAAALAYVVRRYRDASPPRKPRLFAR